MVEELTLRFADSDGLCCHVHDPSGSRAGACALRRGRIDLAGLAPPVPDNVWRAMRLIGLQCMEGSPKFAHFTAFRDSPDGGVALCETIVPGHGAQFAGNEDAFLKLLRIPSPRLIKRFVHGLDADTLPAFDLLRQLSLARVRDNELAGFFADFKDREGFRNAFSNKGVTSELQLSKAEWFRLCVNKNNREEGGGWAKTWADLRRGAEILSYSRDDKPGLLRLARIRVEVIGYVAAARSKRRDALREFWVNRLKSVAMTLKHGVAATAITDTIDALMKRKETLDWDVWNVITILVSGRYEDVEWVARVVTSFVGGKDAVLEILRRRIRIREKFPHSSIDFQSRFMAAMDTYRTSPASHLAAAGLAFPIGWFTGARTPILRTIQSLKC
jgi:hypothetical protein